jgi:hypothetical protein
VVELVRDTEKQVVSEFMMETNTNFVNHCEETPVHKRKLQNKELNITTDDNFKLQSARGTSEGNTQNLWRSSDWSGRQKSEVSIVKEVISEEPGMKEEKAQCIQPMQQVLIMEEDLPTQQDLVAEDLAA